jgi:hypothetical protein
MGWSSPTLQSEEWVRTAAASNLAPTPQIEEGDVPMPKGVDPPYPSPATRAWGHHTLQDIFPNAFSEHPLDGLVVAHSSDRRVGADSGSLAHSDVPMPKGVDPPYPSLATRA